MTQHPLKIGIGYDAHKLVPNRPLILGGVTIPHSHGLLGHSDADVLTHTLMDALLGALALGSIGVHFPDTDPTYKDSCSITLLRQVMDTLHQHHYYVGNVDSVIVAQAPKLTPYIPQMQACLAPILGIPTHCVGIKATTTEHLGPEGRKEGISAHAVVLLHAAT